MVYDIIYIHTPLFSTTVEHCLLLFHKHYIYPSNHYNISISATLTKSTVKTLIVIPNIIYKYIFPICLVWYIEPSIEYTKISVYMLFPFCPEYSVTPKNT